MHSNLPKLRLCAFLEISAAVGVKFPNCSEATQFFFKLAGFFVLFSQRSPQDVTRIDSAVFFCGKLKATIRNSGASEQFESPIIVMVEIQL